MIIDVTLAWDYEGKRRYEFRTIKSNNCSYVKTRCAKFFREIAKLERPTLDAYWDEERVYHLDGPKFWKRRGGLKGRMSV